MMRPPGYLPDVPAKPGRTAVYRLYDRRGALLYVGITNSIRDRFAQHAADKLWWPAVHSRTVEWCPSRRAALEAEWFAIKNEGPIHNKQHNDDYRGRAYTAPKSSRKSALTALIGSALIGGAVSGMWEMSAFMWAATVGAVLVAAWILWERATG